MSRLINADDIPYVTDETYLHEFDYAYRYAIDAMPTVDAYVWNSVTEKKPKPYEYVLVTVKGASHNFIESALYVTDLEKWDKNKYKGEHRSAWVVWDDVWHYYYELSDVIAWIPNIEPYGERT